MKQIFYIYREGRRYFLEENSGLFTKDELELVDNVPKMLRSFVGRAKKMKVEASDESFDGATKLTLQHEDIEGVEYAMETERGKVTGWLCSVYFHFYSEPIKELFITVEKVE